jgi:hypothetical protein
VVVDWDPGPWRYERGRGERAHAGSLERRPGGREPDRLGRGQRHGDPRPRDGRAHGVVLGRRSGGGGAAPRGVLGRGRAASALHLAGGALRGLLRHAPTPGCPNPSRTRGGARRVWCSRARPTPTGAGTPPACGSTTSPGMRSRTWSRAWTWDRSTSRSGVRRRSRRTAR